MTATWLNMEGSETYRYLPFVMTVFKAKAIVFKAIVGRWVGIRRLRKSTADLMSTKITSNIEPGV